MSIKRVIVFASFSLLVACQTTPQTVPGAPQPTSSAPQPTASATSDISTTSGQSPIPTTTPLPTPTTLPTPGSIPSPIAQASASSNPLPPPVFHLPLPTCSGCGFKLTSVWQAAWSPDSKQLAYVLYDSQRSCMGRNTSSGVQGICSINDERQAFVKSVQTEASRAVTEKNRVVDLRGWSPLGDRILLELFSLEANGNNQVFTVKPDGSQLSRVYPTQARQHLPAWSADGKQIAFIAPELNRNVSWIEVVNSDGSNWRQLTSMNDFPRQFSWNNARVAFTEPWSENTPGAPFGSRLRTVSTLGETSVLPLSGIEDETLMDFQWSPDGKQLAYISVDYSGNQAHLMLAAGDGSMQREIKLGIRSDSGSVFSGLTWSPDSRFLAYAQASVTSERAQVSDLYLYEPQTQSTQQLTRAGETGLPVFYRKPSWSPDGKRLAFISNHEVKFREVYEAPDSLYTMNRDGSDIQLEVRGTHVETKSEPSAK